MYVDVYRRGVYIEEDEIRRGEALGYEVLVGLHDGLVQVGTAEIAAAYEEELVAQCFAGALRPAYEAADAYH